MAYHLLEWLATHVWESFTRVQFPPLSKYLWQKENDSVEIQPTWWISLDVILSFIHFKQAEKRLWLITEYVNSPFCLAILISTSYFLLFFREGCLYSKGRSYCMPEKMKGLATMLPWMMSLTSAVGRLQLHEGLVSGNLPNTGMGSIKECCIISIAKFCNLQESAACKLSSSAVP